MALKSINELVLTDADGKGSAVLKAGVTDLSSVPTEEEIAFANSFYSYPAALTTGDIELSFTASSEITSINVRENEDADSADVAKGELAAFGAGDLL